MTLKEINPNEINMRSISKQSLIREILDQFKKSNMTCAEIENWEDISDTLEDFRTIVRNQISYRNGSLYKNIRIITRTGNGYKAYLLKKETEDGENEIS